MIIGHSGFSEKDSGRGKIAGGGALLSLPWKDFE